jgi:hypothetical protein
MMNKDKLLSLRQVDGSGVGQSLLGASFPRVSVEAFPCPPLKGRCGRQSSRPLGPLDMEFEVGMGRTGLEKRGMEQT